MLEDFIMFFFCNGMIVSEFRSRIQERTVYFSNHKTETVEADNKNGSL